MPVRDYVAGVDAPIRDDTYVHTEETTTYRRPGEQAVIWILWALAFAFWAFSFSSAIGIFHEVFQPAAEQVPGGPGGGELGLILLAGVAFFLFAVGLIWASIRAAGRDKGLDATTEASTRALYDTVERAGGDDMVTRSPGARKPFERDSYRPA